MFQRNLVRAVVASLIAGLLAVPTITAADATANNCAEGKVIIGQGGGLATGNLDGSGSLTVYKSLGYNPVGIASDGAKVAWLNAGSAYIMECDGGTVTAIAPPAGAIFKWDMGYDPGSKRYFAGGMYNSHPAILSFANDGTDVRVQWSDVTSSENGFPPGISVLNGRVAYCSVSSANNASHIYVGKFGSGQIFDMQMVYSNSHSCNAVAFDTATGKMWWADYAASKIWQGKLDGSVTPTALYSGEMSPSALKLDRSTNPYGITWQNGWGSGGALRRGDVNGGTVVTIYNTTDSNAAMIFPGPQSPPEGNNGTLRKVSFDPIEGNPGDTLHYYVNDIQGTNKSFYGCWRFLENGVPVVDENTDENGLMVGSIAWMGYDITFPSIHSATPTIRTMELFYYTSSSAPADCTWVDPVAPNVSAYYTVLPDIPAAPAAPTPTTATATSVTLQLNTPNTDAPLPTKYRFSVSDDPTKYCEVDADADPLSCEITGLDSDTEYTFVSTAYNGDQKSDDSTESSAYSTLVGAYDVMFVSNGGSSVSTITWTVGDAAITLPTPTRENYSFDGWFSDEALSVAVSSPFTPDSDTTLYAGWTLLPLLQPAPPSLIEPGTGSLTVTINPNTDGFPPTSYRVYVNEDPTKFCDVPANADPLQCTINGLKVGGLYTVSVVALDATNDRSSAGSTPTPQVKASVPTTPVTPRPSTPTAPKELTPTDGGVTVKIAPVTAVGGSPVVKYIVMAVEDQTKKCEVLATANPLQCTVTGLANGGMYSFVVIAVSADGTKSFTSQRSKFVVVHGALVKGKLYKIRVVVFFGSGSSRLDVIAQRRIWTAVNEAKGHNAKAVIKGFVQKGGSAANDKTLAAARVAASKLRLSKLGVKDIFASEAYGVWPKQSDGRRVVIIIGYRA